IRWLLNTSVFISLCLLLVHCYQDCIFGPRFFIPSTYTDSKMVRMVMEIRPDPRFFDDTSSSLLECKPMRGRSGTLRSGRPTRSRKPSRAGRSPSQQFASRIYWREVTQAELRQQQRQQQHRDAVSLGSGTAMDSQQNSMASNQLENAAGASDERRAPAYLLNAFVNRALECHAQTKMDQRIANEWEMVEDVDAEEYVLL
ncbi:hypothetical protein Vretifemale_11488, partial [Volvox reticuliferus]